MYKRSLTLLALLFAFLSLNAQNKAAIMPQYRTPHEYSHYLLEDKNPEPYYRIHAMDEINSYLQKTLKTTKHKNPKVPCKTQDSLILVTFYYSTGGDCWVNNSGWLTEPVSEWTGVKIDENGNVTSIVLAYNNLNGHIPPELGGLSYLDTLDLSYNKLTGNIPPELGNLSNLRFLSLYYNELTGNIPTELGNLSNLKYLDLCCNNLTGNIPTELGNLNNLEMLILCCNELTGYFPNIVTELSSLSNLKAIELSANQLTGNIPTELGNLSNLEYLGLSRNNLTGNIPTELENLSNLYYLNLSRNNLTENIPSELGSLSNLERLYLCCNKFTGNIPPELGNLSNLKSLDLCCNELTGNIPTELGNLSNLQYLSLSWNNLTGNIPPEFGNLTNLLSLVLNNNKLTGAIPAELSNLENLYGLNLSNNQFDSISADFGYNLSWYLYLQNNYFDFSDLEHFSHIPSSHQLSPQKNMKLYITNLDSGQYRLSVERNGTHTFYQWYRFENPIYDANDTFLIVQEPGVYYCVMTNPDFPELTLYSEPFELDTSWLHNGVKEQDYQALVALYNATNGDNWYNNDNWLTDQPVNNWYGVTVNGYRVVRLNLPRNNLEGYIPPEIGNLDKLLSLGLWLNNLEGTIPPEIGNLTELIYLVLYGNKLTGNLPIELGNLHKLKRLDVDYNKLSGDFPQAIEQLDSVEIIFLDHNNFSGSVPYWLNYLEKLKELYISANQFDQLPVFYTYKFNYLYAEENKFDFGDLEPNANAAYIFYYYSQANVGDTMFYKLVQGNDYTFTVSTPGNYNHYVWYKNGIPMCNQTSPTLTIDNATLADTGTYQCRITNDSAQNLILWSNPIYLRTNVYTVTFAVSDGTNPVKNANISIIGQNLTTDDNGQASIDLASGTYTAITSKDGYRTDTTEFTVLNADLTVNIILQRTTSVPNANQAISIWPNPATDYLLIRVPTANDYTVELYNLTGVKLLRAKLHSEINLLDIASLNPGLYILRINNGRNYTQIKLIKR